MDALEEMFGLDPDSPETRRADFLVECDMRMLDRLVEIRRDRNLSQRQVGEIMGVSQPTVAQFEAHDSNPRLSTIRRYAMAVGALVRHEVVPDEGQLEDGRWTFEMVLPMPSPAQPASGSFTIIIDAGELRTSGAAPFPCVDGKSTERADFALAA